MEAIRLEPTGRERNLVGQIHDWPALRQMAASHGVFPLVYKRLRSIGGDLVPPAELETWRQTFRDNAARNMLLTADLLRILRLFESQSIVAVPFKGPVLAEAAYGDVTMRMFVDLDILVQQQDVLRARDALIAQGYRLSGDFTPRRQQAHLKRVVEFVLCPPSGAYSVDLHFRLAANYLAARLDSQAIFARRQAGWLTGQRIATLAADDLLLYLCLHATVHLWAELGHICDVGKVVSATPGLDWQGLLAKAERAGLKRILLLGLTLARDLMALHVPADIASLVERDRVLQKLSEQVQSRLFADADHPVGFAAASLFHLRAKELWQDRARYLWIRTLHPTIEDWRWVSLPDRFYALYYALRPLRLLLLGLVVPLSRCAVNRQDASLPAAMTPEAERPELQAPH